MSGKSSQIFGVILFIAVGVSAIFLGVKQYLEKVKSPFAVSNAAVASMQNQANGDILPQDNPNSKTDTDADGLTDYQETHIYRTSPYLSDSDSDGTIDGVEVKKGADPNCPQGQTCSNPIPSSGEIDVVDLNMPTEDTSELDSQLNALINGAENAANAPAENVNVGTPSASDIRAMLIDAGMDAAALTGISDEDLVKLYEESLAEMSAQAANQNVNANGNASQ